MAHQHQLQRSTPWYAVPVDRKWYRNLIVADRVVNSLEDMKLKDASSA